MGDIWDTDNKGQLAYIIAHVNSLSVNIFHSPSPFTLTADPLNERFVYPFVCYHGWQVAPAETPQ